MKLQLLEHSFHIYFMNAMPAIPSDGMSATGYPGLVELTQPEQVSVEEFEQSLQDFDVGTLSSAVEARQHCV